MCTVGENCCPPTENRFTKRAEGAPKKPLVGGVCCSEEDCCAAGTHIGSDPFDQMEFWGTEVTPGKGQLNEPGEETYIHVSQAALGPSKDGKSERVVIRVESGGKNYVLGTLASGKVDQMTLDLIFDREFKLSHTSTSSSVFFCGYRTDKGQEYSGDEFDDEDDDGEESDEEDDEPVPTAVPMKQNGTVSAKEGARVAKKETKVIEAVVEKKAKKEVPRPGLLDFSAVEGEESEEEDDEEDDDDEVDDEDGSDEEDDSDEDDSDDEDDDDDDDEDDVAAELGKKRSLTGSAKKSPGEGKKPRLDTPAKPGLISAPGKKAGKGAVDTKATPVSTKKSEGKAVPAKTPQKTPGKEAKTPKSEKSTPTTPLSGETAKKIGAHYCADCKRNFTTESALSQHAVAKHKK